MYYTYTHIIMVSLRSLSFFYLLFRLYIQLPLPSAHRYHHIGNSMEAFQKELANLDNVLMETISVDNRILEQLQTFVRQGYTNPFQVRAGLKVSFLFCMSLKR